MYKVYFDSNERTEDGRYLLWFDKSLQDFERIPGGPRAGMRALIYMTGEIEMEATLEFDTHWNEWTAQNIIGTLRNNTDTWD